MYRKQVDTEHIFICTLQQWETIYEDDFSAPEPEPEPESDDSDFEFDGVRTKKISKRKKDKERKEKEKEKEKEKVPIFICLSINSKHNIISQQLATSKPVKEQSARRRTHADSIPDSEKPFACDCKLNVIFLHSCFSSLLQCAWLVTRLGLA